MAGTTRATGRRQARSFHEDSLEVRASIARLIAFCRGVSNNDKYASITFEDRAEEAIGFIDNRLSEIASLRGAIPKVIGKMDSISDLGDLTLPEMDVPDFYGISEAIPSISDVIAEFNELGLDLDSPLSDYDMLESPEGFGDVDLAFTEGGFDELENALDRASSSSSLEAEPSLGGIQEDLDLNGFAPGDVANAFSTEQEDL